MPVNGIYTQTVEILNNFYAKDDQYAWEQGSMEDTTYRLYSSYDHVNETPIYKRQLELAQHGEDIDYKELNKDSFLVYKSWSNVEVIGDSLNAQIQLKINPTTGTYYDTGYRIIEMDLSRVTKYASSNFQWSLVNGNYDSYDSSGSAFSVQVSHDNGSTWVNFTGDGLGDVYQNGTYIEQGIPGMTKGQSTSGKKILIKQVFKRTYNNLTPKLTRFELYVWSAYKTSGTWTSPRLAVSDTRITEVVADAWSAGANYSGTSYTFEVSIDDGKTWRVVSSGTPILRTSDFPTARYLLMRFKFATTDIRYSPQATLCSIKYWGELPVYETATSESEKSKIKEFQLLINTAKNSDITWELLTDNRSFTRQIRLTQDVNGIVKRTVGTIVEKPRVFKAPNKEQIAVKCYDLAHLATQKLFNDQYPKYNVRISSNSKLEAIYGTSLTERDFETWHDVIVHAWIMYGPPDIEIKIGAGYIEENTSKFIPVGSAFSSIYEFMDKICTMTGWTWQIEDNKVRFYQATANTLSTVFQSDRNIVGIPDVTDETPEVTNVVIIPVRVRQPGFTEYQNAEIGKAVYNLQYTPLKREFESKSGTVELDKPPVVSILGSNGVWTELVTVEDGAEIQPGDPTPQAYYNVENKWVKLVDAPTASKTDGIKIVYTIELSSIFQRSNPESVQIFGERHHFISSKVTRDEAEKIANNYLFQHSFPVTPISLETTEWDFKVGDYVRVYLPEQGIDQIMPIVQIDTQAGSINLDVKVILNRAPINESDLIIDLFKRLKELERKDVENDISVEQYQSWTENTMLIEEVYINGMLIQPS